MHPELCIFPLFFFGPTVLCCLISCTLWYGITWGAQHQQMARIWIKWEPGVKQLGALIEHVQEHQACGFCHLDKMAEASIPWSCCLDQALRQMMDRILDRTLNDLCCAIFSHNIEVHGRGLCNLGTCATTTLSSNTSERCYGLQVQLITNQLITC